MQPSSTETRDRFRGVVKFFNSQKGYGFIIPLDVKHVNPNGRNEIFVHHSAIINEGGFKSLAENEQVEYSLSEGPKGIQAADVTGPGGAPVLGDPMINKIFLQNGFSSYGTFGPMGYHFPPYYSTSMYPLHSMHGMQHHPIHNPHYNMAVSSQIGAMTTEGYNIDNPVVNTQNGHNVIGQQASLRYQGTTGQAYNSAAAADQTQLAQNRLSSSGSTVSSQQSPTSKDDSSTNKLAINSHAFIQANAATPPSPLRTGNGGHTSISGSFSGNGCLETIPSLSVHDGDM